MIERLRPPMTYEALNSGEEMGRLRATFRAAEAAAEVAVAPAAGAAVAAHRPELWPRAGCRGGALLARPREAS